MSVTFEEIKGMLKKSIEEAASINEALERVVQSIYSKGYEDGSQSVQSESCEWTLVGTELPKPGKRVFVCDINEDIYIARCYHRHKAEPYVYTNADWYTDSLKWLDVVAWQPLPAKYKVR